MWVVEVLFSLPLVLTSFFTLLYVISYNLQKEKETRYDFHLRLPVLSVIVPVTSNEEATVKSTLSSLRNQSFKKFKTYVVVPYDDKKIYRKMEKLRAKYKFELIVQNKKGLVDAYLSALKRIKTKWVAVLNSDVVLRRFSLGLLLSHCVYYKPKVCAGVILPARTSSLIGKIINIKKYIRQFFFQVGRYSLNLGAYIPGAFYIAESKFLKDSLREGFTDDVDLMLKIYSSSYKILLLSIPVATEHEKKGIRGWILQFSRWFIGNIEIGSSWLNFIRKGEFGIKIGVFSLLLIWYIFPISFIITIPFIFLSKIYLLVWIANYLTISVIIFFQLPKEYKLLAFVFLFVYSISKVCGIFISPYTYYLLKSKNLIPLYRRK
jgi:cellulose synthase/poly-beta-1,6-N-acetylglucosamine synthase-like glycosyltransferase